MATQRKEGIKKGKLVSTRIKRQDCQNKTKSGLKVVKEKINQKVIILKQKGLKTKLKSSPFK